MCVMCPMSVCVNGIRDRVMYVSFAGQKLNFVIFWNFNRKKMFLKQEPLVNHLILLVTEWNPTPPCKLMSSLKTRSLFPTGDLGQFLLVAPFLIP